VFAPHEKSRYGGIRHGGARCHGNSPSPQAGKPVMSWLIGVLTVASTIFGVLLGQVAAGFESLGVILAGIVLMTLRA
jgi:hypothetical protein